MDFQNIGQSGKTKKVKEVKEKTEWSKPSLNISSVDGGLAVEIRIKSFILDSNPKVEEIKTTVCTLDSIKGLVSKLPR